MRSEDGFTLVEMGMAALVGAVVLALASTLLVAAQRTGVFTSGQGFTINDARNAMQQIEKEVRSADFINWCTPAGSCLMIGAQTPSGGTQTIRYTHSNEVLERERFDPDSGAWTDPQPLINRVANTSSQPVFACETDSSLVRVTVDLHIESTPQSDPTFNVRTAVTPRNFGTNQNCP